MRVHDINLVADLTAHDPNDPYPCDGTVDGRVSASGGNALLLATSLLMDAMSILSVYWTGPWPELHFAFTAFGNLPDYTSSFHVKLSLLQVVSVVSIQLSMAVQNIVVNPMPEIFEAIAEFALLGLSSGIALYLWRTAETHPEAGLGTILGAWIATLAAVVLPILFFDVLIDNGWDAVWAAGALILAAVAMAYISFGNLILQYLGMRFTGRFYTLVFQDWCDSFKACCEGSILVRFFSCVFMIVWFGLAAIIMLQGRVFV